MSSHLSLFAQVSIGSLFIREYKSNALPYIKVDSTHARRPSGEVVEVNAGVLVFTAYPKADNQPIAVDLATQEVKAVAWLLKE